MANISGGFGAPTRAFDNPNTQAMWDALTAIEDDMRHREAQARQAEFERVITEAGGVFRRGLVPVGFELPVQAQRAQTAFFTSLARSLGPGQTHVRDSPETVGEGDEEAAGAGGATTASTGSPASSGRGFSPSGSTQ